MVCHWGIIAQLTGVDARNCQLVTVSEDIIMTNNNNNSNDSNNKGNTSGDKDSIELLFEYSKVSAVDNWRNVLLGKA